MRLGFLELRPMKLRHQTGLHRAEACHWGLWSCDKAGADKAEESVGAHHIRMGTLR